MTKGSRKRCLATAISLALASYTPGSAALGLGGASVQSRIGEPLLAEIPILDGSKGYQPNDILVRQVRGKLAEQLGFDLAADAPSYFLKIVQQDEQLVLLVRSKRTMSEPFVSVLVELEWPSGKLYRDYNLLLDLAPLTVEVPVVSGAGHSTNVQTSVSSSSSEGPSRSSPLKSGSSFAIASSNGSVTAPVRAAYSEGDGWRVGGGDTLSQIAQKIRPDDQIKLTAVVEALFQLNPHAFLNGDINRMQGGSLLKLPSQEQFMGMPRWDGRVGVVQSSRSVGQPPLPDANSARPNVVSKASVASTDSGPIRVVPRKGEHQTVVSDNAVDNELISDRVKAAPNNLEDYVIQAGDTLSQIAQKLRRDPRVRLQDMMRLLYDSNPQAFVDGDMNRLQLGASLSVPDHGNWSAPAVLALAQIESQDRSTEPSAEEVGRSEQPVGEEPKGVDVESLYAEQSNDGVDSQAARLVLSSNENGSVSLGEQGSSAQQILYQIDAVAELVDKVNRENQAIRQRIERIEHSEQLALLERLLELQTRQIQNLRQAMIDQSKVGEGETQAPALLVDGAESSVTKRLGNDGLVVNAEAKLLEEHLRKTSIDEESNAEIDLPKPAQVLTEADSEAQAPNLVSTQEASTALEPKGGAVSVIVSSVAAVLLLFIGWLLVFRRRPVYQWLNGKLNLFEQNEDQASLPRVWDPELGAWRVREDIRKPVLTPLETSLDDIETALQRHNEKHEGVKSSELSGASGNTQASLKKTTLQDRLEAEVEQEEPLNEVIDESSESNKSFDLDGGAQDIDSMFEELPPELGELGNAPSEPDFVEADAFPLLNDIAEKGEPSQSRVELQGTGDFQVDNLDGEFDFSLPDELFEVPDAESAVTRKPVSEADARVKAAIVEKTRNYNPESIDEALDNWLGGSIPAPELSEYEDVISEAMIYAAYGRHEHAEQLLLEQIKLNPDEEELQSALADVQKSASQFKGGEGFGDLKGSHNDTMTPLDLPNKPEAFEGMTLDLDGYPPKPKD